MMSVAAPLIQATQANYLLFVSLQPTLAAHRDCPGDGNVATCGLTDFEQAALGEAVFVDLPEVAAALMERRLFATIRANNGPCYPFHVHGVNNDKAENRDTFAHVENAINFIYANGFHRLEAQEERSLKIVMNGVMNGADNVDGKTVPNIVVAVFSKPLFTTEVPINKPIDRTNNQPRIATISLLPKPDTRGCQYEVRGHQDRQEDGAETFKYVEDILNMLSESGYHRLDPLKEDLWKQFIQMLLNTGDDKVTLERGTLTCVFSK